MSTPTQLALNENKNSVVSFLEKSGEAIGLGALGRKMAGVLNFSFSQNFENDNKAGSAWYATAFMSVITSATDAIKGFFSKEKEKDAYPFPQMQQMNAGPKAPVKDLLAELNISSNSMDDVMGKELLKSLNITSNDLKDVASQEIMRDFNITSNDINDAINRQVQKTSMESRLTDSLRL